MVTKSELRKAIKRVETTTKQLKYQIETGHWYEPWNVINRLEERLEKLKAELYLYYSKRGWVER